MAEPITFDYNGAIELARRLWQTADSVETMSQNRYISAHQNLQQFTGPKANEFFELSTTERNKADQVSESLRQDATNWGKAWAEAVNTQNRQNYLEAEQHRLNSLARAEDQLVLDGGAPTPSSWLQEPNIKPAEVAPPMGPNFFETGQVTSY